MIAIVAVAMIGVMVPNVFATSGEIFLEKNEFVLYGDGSMVNFSVTGEIFDYVYYPELEIMIDDVVFQTVDIFPNKNSIFSIIGLDKNWSHGEYVVNLKYKNKSKMKKVTMKKDFKAILLPIRIYLTLRYYEYEEHLLF